MKIKKTLLTARFWSWMLRETLHIPSSPYCSGFVVWQAFLCLRVRKRAGASAEHQVTRKVDILADRTHPCALILMADNSSSPLGMPLKEDVALSIGICLLQLVQVLAMPSWPCQHVPVERDNMFSITAKIPCSS
eukprot:1154840-Pelagomonas_calceolata.AAC.4